MGARSFAKTSLPSTLERASKITRCARSAGSTLVAGSSGLDGIESEPEASSKGSHCSKTRVSSILAMVSTGVCECWDSQWSSVGGGQAGEAAEPAGPRVVGPARASMNRTRDFLNTVEVAVGPASEVVSVEVEAARRASEESTRDCVSAALAWGV